MFLRPHSRSKDGKDHTYWSLVETVRTPDGPRQKTLCYLGELNSSAQARWLTTVEVFNEQGEAQQLKLFPSHVAPPADDPQVARVLLNKVRLERTRQFGSCFLGLELVEAARTGSFLSTDRGWRTGRRALVARGCLAGDQPAMRAGQRTGHRAALVSIHRAGRPAGDRRRQDQRYPPVPLSGPHCAAQDQVGAASE